MKTVCLLIVALLAAGCGGTTWYHPFKGDQGFYRDNSECKAMANSGGQPQMAAGSDAFSSGYNKGAAIGAAKNRRQIYEHCMRGRGWAPQ